MKGLKNRRKRHAGGHTKKAAAVYGIICVLAVLMWAAGQRLFPDFPEAALLEPVRFLFPGGAVVFLLLAYLCPAAEQSEFYRVFELLYHPGICLLALVSFAGEAGTWSGYLAESFCMAYIAGWTLLAAGVIILILMIKEKHS